MSKKALINIHVEILVKNVCVYVCVSIKMGLAIVVDTP